MERINEENINDILKNEHQDRYIFASQLIHGDVLDLACGIGYGSEVLFNNSKIESYTGVDVSEEAIVYANNTYKNSKNNFINDNALTIDLKEKSFDVIISFETLEHIYDYESVLSNFSKWLKDDGILVGSVPEANWENLCDETYGKNPYHVVRFDIQQLESGLKKHFQYVQLFTNELAIGSLFRNISGDSEDKIDLKYDNFSGKTNGSIYFIASNKHFVINKNIFFPSMCLVEYDGLKISPLIHMIDERDKAIASQTYMIDERDKAIKAQAKMIDERDDYIKKLEAIVNDYKNK